MNRAKVISVNPVEPTLGSMYFVAQSVVPRYRVLDAKYGRDAVDADIDGRLMFPERKRERKPRYLSLVRLFVRKCIKLRRN